MNGTNWWKLSLRPPSLPIRRINSANNTFTMTILRFGLALLCSVFNVSMSSDSAKAVHIIERERLKRHEIDREMTRHWRYFECEIRIDQEIIARQANKVRAQELKILEHNDHSIKQKYSLTGLDHILESRMNSQTFERNGSNTRGKSDFEESKECIATRITRSPEFYIFDDFRVEGNSLQNGSRAARFTESNAWRWRLGVLITTRRYLKDHDFDSPII